MGMFVIKPKLTEEWLLSHIEDLDILITLRLQRLFMSLKTVEHMTLHHSYDAVDEMMRYPFDGEA